MYHDAAENALDSIFHPTGLTNIRFAEELFVPEVSRLGFSSLPEGLQEDGGQTLLNALLSGNSRDELGLPRRHQPSDQTPDQVLIAQSSAWPLFTPEGGRVSAEARTGSRPTARPRMASRLGAPPGLNLGNFTQYNDIMEECVGY